MIILYIFLLIGLFLFYMLYSDDLSLIVLLSAAAAPLLMFIQLLYTSRRISFSAADENIRMNKGQETEMDIYINNRTIFPMPITKIKVKCVLFPTGETVIKNVTVPVPAKSTRRISITLYSEYCRRIECSISEIRFYDMLHLFSIKKRQDICSTASVDFIPSGDYVMDGEASGKLGLPVLPSGAAGTARKKAALDEYDELRAYRDGDKMNRIAWKLSGRNGDDELIVRDSGNVSAPDILLAADTSSVQGAGDADRLYECFYKAAHILLDHDKLFDCVTSSGAVIRNVSSANDIDRCISQIYGRKISASEITVNCRYDAVYIITVSEYADAEKTKLREKFYGAEINVICASADSRNEQDHT